MLLLEKAAYTFKQGQNDSFDLLNACQIIYIQRKKDSGTLRED